jgi:CHAT domain-containing protein
VIRSAALAGRRDALLSDLVWLYDRLLRPFQADLADKSHVFVVPVGPLAYVPFSALISSLEPTVEYAVKRHSFGYLPSMYMLDLVLRDLSSVSVDSLVMANPDGTLQGAEQEATVVHRLLAATTPLLLGGSASYENLLQHAGDKRVLHLATHARLDPANVEQSYLLLANGRRFSVLDVMTLPLGETDLAVLSACETGIGGAGQEYATLARAFAHAGVPSIVATLWRVNDQASRRLIEALYRHLGDGDDVVKALSSAQRDMLAGDASFREPWQWAGFVSFGKAVTVR